MNIIKALFSGGDLLDKAAGAADALHFSKQEKAGHIERMMKLYEPFRIAQRFLALIFCIPYSLAWSSVFIGSFFMDSIDSQISLLSGDIGRIVFAIVAFYFLGGAAEGAVKAFRKTS